MTICTILPKSGINSPHYFDKDALKTSSEDVWVRWIYSSGSRRLEDVLKMSSEKEDERRLQDVFKTPSSTPMFAGVALENSDSFTCII